MVEELGEIPEVMLFPRGERDNLLRPEGAGTPLVAVSKLR
jgi:hypothetical protein